jgi:F-type H+-transporting ATPase subunit alpha
MNNHAKSYRTIALLIKNPPGREAYPGDIFYQQARLLERAAQLAKRFGFGSLSAFPVYETQMENIKTFIATNLISITDGQLYLSRKIFQTGLRPAIDMFKSVSRIGTRAQPEILT